MKLAPSPEQEALAVVDEADLGQASALGDDEAAGLEPATV